MHRFFTKLYKHTENHIGFLLKIVCETGSEFLLNKLHYY